MCVHVFVSVCESPFCNVEVLPGFKYTFLKQSLVKSHTVEAQLGQTSALTVFEV